MTNEPDNSYKESDDSYFDPADMERQRHQYSHMFEDMLSEGREQELAEKAADLSPGDLSEIVKPLSVEDTARVITLLPQEMASDLLAEIDKRSVTAVMHLMDIEAIADLVEEMPSDEATDLVGDLDHDKARELLLAIEEEERQEIQELLRYPPDSAGGLMAKEYVAVNVEDTCRHAVDAVREIEKDDRADLHFIYVVDAENHLLGRIQLVEMLMLPWSTPVSEVMESDPLRVSYDLDQEQVAQYVSTHDLVSLPVVDEQNRMVGIISADDVLDVIQEEATEDFSMMAGTSMEEFGEKSSLKVAQARLPWLMGALVGEVGCILMMQHFEAALTTTIALAFFIPAIMAMGGNTGIQTSSVVVRGLATGEVDIFHIGQYLARELAAAVMTGGLISLSLFLIAGLVVGDVGLAVVLTMAMFAVIVCAALIGTAVPLTLYKFGIDPAIATGPFITTSNDIIGILIYLGIATLMLK